MSRSRAETMPAVTVPPRPNGLPIAITQSPTRSASLSPKRTKGSLRSAFTFRSARSVFGSRPRISASSVSPSEKVTVTSSASSTTWLLVTTRPSGSITKPEPSDCTRRCCGWLPPWRSKNSSKYSSNGEPGGNSGSGTALPPDTVCAVEMLTTAGVSFSARSAKLSGAERACAGVQAMEATPMAKAAPTASVALRIMRKADGELWKVT